MQPITPATAALETGRVVDTPQSMARAAPPPPFTAPAATPAASAGPTLDNTTAHVQSKIKSARTKHPKLSGFGLGDGRVGALKQGGGQTCTRQGKDTDVGHQTRRLSSSSILRYELSGS